MPDRRAARRACLLELLQADELDGLLVTHVPNVRYLTGFTGSAGLALVTPASIVFVSDFRYRTQAEREVGDAARVEIAPSDIWECLAKLLEEGTAIERLGFESHALTVAQAEAARERLPRRVQLQSANGLVERLRVKKDEREVAAIRQAAALAGEAFAATLPTVRVGMSERDVAARLEQELRVRGSEWHPFPTIAASGPRTALPHASTTSRTIERGDWLLLDFGAQVDGYCADLTRTMVVGRRADEQQRAVYTLVEQAQRLARTAIRVGMKGREADALARDPITARGYGEAFGHSLGHGLGLEVHEAPRVSARNEDPLSQGAVVTIEPGIYLPGWGGVRIEDDVYLGAEGPELLSDGQTALTELT